MQLYTFLSFENESRSCYTPIQSSRDDEPHLKFGRQWRWQSSAVWAMLWACAFVHYESCLEDLAYEEARESSNELSLMCWGLGELRPGESLTWPGQDRQALAWFASGCAVLSCSQGTFPLQGYWQERSSSTSSSNSEISHRQSSESRTALGSVAQNDQAAAHHWPPD